MRRLFWVAVGVGVTVYVVRKVNQANEVASQFTPAGIVGALNNVADSVRSFTSEFKESMAEHEERLSQALLSEPEESPQARRRSPRYDMDPDFVFDEGDPEEFF